MTGYYYDCRLRDNAVHIKRQTGVEELKVSFRRTVRVPDNSVNSNLPPDLGKLPLYKVQDHMESLPTNIVAKGGVFMPMYQREAMWIKFKANAPFAIKAYVGSVNAISGKAADADPARKPPCQTSTAQEKVVQDYMVVPGQLWLDGIASSAGVVKQFVATRVGDGYNVEAQVTGEEAHGGLQFEITPAAVDIGPLRSIMVKTVTGKTITIGITRTTTGADVKDKLVGLEGTPADQQRLIMGGRQIADDGPIPRESDVFHIIPRLRGGGHGIIPPQTENPKMGIAAGGKIEQSIVRDGWPAETWHKTATIAFNVHILNANVFESVTGLPAPQSPITAKTYQQLGLPFFKLYEEPSDIHGAFENVKSIGEIDGVEERDCVMPTTVINMADKETANRGKHAEDISNPTGPFSIFRSVAEIEQELRGMGIESSG